MLSNNRISRISKDFAAVCPRLETIILSGNRLTSFAELDNLPKQLKRLVCIDNVVYNLPNYRSYVVFRFPQLKMLDYQKVTKAEREQAQLLFSNSENLDKVYNADKAKAVAEEIGSAEVPQQQRELLIELDKQLELADSLEKIQQIEKKIKQLRESNPNL